MKEKKIGGIPANRLLIPIIAVLVVLHLMVISDVVMINITSSALSSTMQSAGVYTQDATSLLGGSSLLSETATSYMLMPVTANGEVNVSPLASYATELGVDRRPDQVLARFEGYDVSDEVRAKMSAAVNSARNMLEAQIHAISLMRTVYPLPEITPLTAIPTAELTEEELAMPDEARAAAARSLMLSAEYGLNKQAVSQNVNEAVAILQADSQRTVAQKGRTVAMLRTLLWVATSSIIIVLTATFITLYRQILAPLGSYVRLIPTGALLDEKKGIKEVRMVASAYNDVLDRRDALEGILRSAAETDALTNLPNRYRMEQYVLESGKSGYSMAVVLFDVNYLKQTNDTLGHLAGDKLLRTAADCISSCFGENCFRYGGDEFAAVVKDCTPETVLRMVNHFEEVERDADVSISWGYAYAPEISQSSFRQLLEEADRHMYVHKQQAHNRAKLSTSPE